MFAKSKARRSTKSFAAVPVLMQPLEDRKMFAGIAADKVVDVGGPVDDMVEAGGQIYVSTPLASGGSNVHIYATDGLASHTKLVLDLTHPDYAKLSSIDELTATEDGRLFFTASTTGGRQLFELNLKTGELYKLTNSTNVIYGNVTAAGDRVYLHERNSKTIYTIAPGAQVLDAVTSMTVDTDFRASGNSVFFVGPDESLWRSNGTAAGTVEVGGGYRVSRGDFFSTNEFVVFEGARTGENASLFIVGLDATEPLKVADDFFLHTNEHAELNGWTYFSGGYYNTAPLANGRQLYRVNAAGVIELASKVPGSNDGLVEGIGAIGTAIYFTASDGQSLPSQGMGDRELYKYDTLTGDTKLVTTGQLLYPVGGGRGVLSNYYFVAAPDKENARSGSRAMYRTNPVTDDVELVAGVPTVQDVNGKDYQRVRDMAVGANGFFFTADSGTNGRETDVFFSHAPFSILDPATKILTITGTDFSDFTSMKAEGGELILNQNGYEERHNLADIERIEAFLRQGDDAFAGEASVFIPTYVIGDEGNDRIQTGSGQDTLTGGAGQNRLFGGEGNDRFVGAGGRDVLGGEGGDDRLIGNGGNDLILAGHGSDWVQGGLGDDLVFGSLGIDRVYGGDGNDKIYGQLSADLIDGGSGDDYIEAGAGIDSIDGGTGRDTIFAGEDDDAIIANDGELDYVVGQEGNDTLTKDAEEELVDLVETIL